MADLDRGFVAVFDEILREPADAVVAVFFLVRDVVAADRVAVFAVCLVWAAVLVASLFATLAGGFLVVFAGFLAVLALFLAVFAGCLVVLVFLDRVLAEVAVRPEVDRVFFLVTVFLAIATILDTPAGASSWEEDGCALRNMESGYPTHRRVLRQRAHRRPASSGSMQRRRCDEAFHSAAARASRASIA